MNLVLIGPPGAGKGTQAERIRDKYAVTHISTGDIFRAMDRESDLGKKVFGYMEKGELVPDDLVIEVVLERLGKDDCRDGWMLDGFPRTVPQAEALDGALENAGKNLDTVLEIRVDDEEIVRRLSGRRIAPGSGKIYHVEFFPPKAEGVCDVSGEPLVHRDDDQPDAIRARLSKFHAQTEPLVPYYSKRTVLKSVEATGMNPDQVWEAIQATLG
jgi:adenylate kinase